MSVINDELKVFSDVPVGFDILAKENCQIPAGHGVVFCTRKSDFQINVNNEWITVSALKANQPFRFFSDGVNFRTVNKSTRKSMAYIFMDIDI